MRIKHKIIEKNIPALTSLEISMGMNGHVFFLFEKNIVNAI